jgi:tripartite-type tricarboxylate transporter receptor subunit TctC
MAGAGSMIAANHIYNVAPKDGSVIGTFGGGMLSNQVLGLDGVQFDMQKYNWLGAVASTTNVCTALDAGAPRSITDTLPPKSQELVLGSTGAGNNTYDYPLLLAKLSGANLKLVSGYPGNNEVRLAMEKGEVDAYCVAWDTAKALHQPWVEAGTPKFSYIVQFGPTRIPELPQVPTAGELLANDEDRAVMRLLVGPDQFFWPFTAPPGVPAERVAILRNAMARAFDDPELNAEAQKAKWTKSPVSGEQIERLLGELLASPEPIKQRFKQLLGR